MEIPCDLSIFEMLKRFFLILFISLTGWAVQAQKQPVASATENANRLASLYPNPAITYINIDLRENFKFGMSVQIHSAIMGKMIFSTQLTQARYVLNVNDYPRGAYVYYLLDPSGKIVEAGKFLITK